MITPAPRRQELEPLVRVVPGFSAHHDRWTSRCQDVGWHRDAETLGQFVDRWTGGDGSASEPART
jgi:hypothetical protein